jgi:AraC family transcriptional regulator, regulatory protein of adaptative response / methylated-DNA-[protein]-cysteine methyltransferase
MTGQEHLNYQRIAEAIDYLRAHFRRQPSLEEVAEIIHLSPFHFQRLFTEWAGVSPKKFLQYISLEHPKQLLKDRPATLFDVAHEAGLSGTGRLHDLFISLEGMTPGEYKNGGERLSIRYRFADSPFGQVIVASTAKGVCHMAFSENELEALDDLQLRFPKAHYSQIPDGFQQHALSLFTLNRDQPHPLKLHVKGTGFQLKVWEALLQIPMGQLCTYGAVAAKAGHPTASRAVGTAIGANPVAFLIPCHRVIQASGIIGGYMWGTTRKTAMIGWEAAKVEGK